MSRAERTASKAYRALYKLASYKRGRVEFLKANPWCVKCKMEGKKTPADVINHKTPHKGDKRLFLDRRNWEPVCTNCHNVQCQRQDIGLPLKGSDVNGWPIDPALRRGWSR